MTQIIVVGAGLAGISAAYELVRTGYDAQVFEANERVGGRTYTVPLSAGQYGELGAEFVDDTHTALLTYAAEFDLKLDPAFRAADDLYWLVNGKLHNQEALTIEQNAALDHLDAELMVNTLPLLSIAATWRAQSAVVSGLPYRSSSLNQRTAIAIF